MDILCKTLGVFVGFMLFFGIMALILLFSLWQRQREIRKESGNKKWSIFRTIAK